jgi:hypothetical protein
MVFYFTYNEATYNIFEKGSSQTLSLHILVQQLKSLELALGCRLEVIHVPGTTMIITQGTDGLSRGVWANGFNTDFKLQYWVVQGDTLGKGALTSCPFCSLLPPTFCTFPQN